MLDKYHVLKQLLRSTAALSGEAFFAQAVAVLARHLGADLAFIAHQTGSQQVHVLASCRHGKLERDWTFDLPGTPCSVLYHDSVPADWAGCTVGDAVSLSEPVLRGFPSVRGTGFQSFVGVPLFTPERRQAGHIALFFARPWHGEPERAAVLELTELFSGQVQAELNRMLLERERAGVLHELELANRRLQAEAITDHLTGLHNRRHFAARMHEAFAGFARGHCPFGLVLLDLDHFKQINDQHGHGAGDDVLRAVAQALRANCRADAEPLFRIGGEEFAVLCFGALDATALRRFGERLNGAVRAIRVEALASLRVSVSVGATVPAPDDGAWAAVYRRADAAMYAAKDGGRDRTVVA